MSNQTDIWIISSDCAVNTFRLGYKSHYLNLYREEVAVSSENHTEHINAVCVQHKISECYSCRYIKKPLDFQGLRTDMPVYPPYLMHTGGSFSCTEAEDRKLTTYVYSVTRLRKCGACLHVTRALTTCCLHIGHFTVICRRWCSGY
jgi:hypothetical protein